MQFETDMKSDHKELFESARKVLLEDYGLTETKKPRITTYSDSNSGVCHMRTMAHGIDVGFLKGVHMEDKYSLLTGKGKVMRVLPISELDIAKLRYYLDQAIEMNAAK